MCIRDRPGTGKTTTVVRLLALLQEAAMANGEPLRLSLALLVFPSREVEAQKTFLDLALGTDAEMVLQEKDDLRAGLPVPGAALSLIHISNRTLVISPRP